MRRGWLIFRRTLVTDDVLPVVFSSAELKLVFVYELIADVFRVCAEFLFVRPRKE